MRQIIIGIPNDIFDKVNELDNVLETYTNSTDFKRAIYRLLMAKSHRGTSWELEQELENILPKIKFWLK